jgi:hypothetical protein
MGSGRTWFTAQKVRPDPIFRPEIRAIRNRNLRQPREMSAGQTKGAGEWNHWLGRSIGIRP